MSTYADASFLASLYAMDVNTPMAMRRLREHPPGIWLSSFAELELFNAIALRLFRKQADPAGASETMALIESDIQSGLFRRRTIPETAYDTAKHLSRKWSSSLGTRAGDLLQVAIALELQTEWFLTFDKRQLQLARAEGLKT